MNKKQKQHQTLVPGNPLAVNVVGNQREDLSFALKSWKRKVKASGVLEKTKDRKEFIKASVVKRKQKQAAQFIQRIKDLNSF
jgi:ribosomal protein S21